jgi:6-phosphogluconolactonase (cycloisomerase 2 family)
MRTRLRGFLIFVAIVPLCSLAALLLYAQAGGDLKPLRAIKDPYPVFTDVAVDPESNIALMSDENLFSLRTYDRNNPNAPLNAISDPRTVITGPKSEVDFVCGVAIDPIHRELYSANNDTDSVLMAFKYEANGEVPPARKVDAAARGTWGVALDLKNDEIAVTVEHINQVEIYQREATGKDKPLRIIQGPKTGISDPHGIAIDAEHNELFVANHNSYHEVGTGEADPNAVSAAFARGEEAPQSVRERVEPRVSKGKFVEPSIRVYSRTANGDAAPLRVIQGPKTRLDLPMKIVVDSVHNEIFVANSGASSILVFNRTANGDAAPIRTIEGPATGINKPVGVYVDVKNDEVWATSPESHKATVYRRTANGNAQPLRTLRGAPEGTPAPGIGNPGGIAYDAKRDQILVPN